MTITENDFPPIFRAADQLSTLSQRAYMRCMFADLFFIVSAGVFGAMSFDNEGFKLGAAVTAAILMICGVILTIIIRSKQYEQLWFEGRAVAESVKTSSWRFMMCSEPYESALSETEAKKQFIEFLKKVVVQHKRSSVYLSLGTEESLTPITDKMMEVRKSTLQERKHLYRVARLEDQVRWYESKKKNNISLGDKWFFAILTVQFMALASTYLLVKYPVFPILLPSVFASIAAAFVAWNQLKRHQELASSYSMAAHELAFITIDLEEVTTNDAFSKFVADAETAISREHTMWVARRDHV